MTYRPRRYVSSTPVTLDGHGSPFKKAKKATVPRKEPEWTREQMMGQGYYSSGREGWYK